MQACLARLALPLLAGALPAAAEVSLAADAGVATAFFDRGEQLAAGTAEVGLAAGLPLGGGEAYAALWRLTPVGSDADAFDHELDYSLGYAGEAGALAYDVSANWLTFPGEESESSLELAVEIGAAEGVDVAFSPVLAAFHDADLEDWGLEVTAGPEWARGGGLWSASVRGRLGFVEPGDGSAVRSYLGAEAVLARAFPGTPWTLAGHVRAEAADEDSFAREIAGGEVVRTGDSGVAVGIVLSAATGR